MVDAGPILQVLLASGSESGGNPLLEIHPGLIIWTIVIFVILAIVLGKFAWKPILKALKQREESIRESLDKERNQAIEQIRHEAVDLAMAAASHLLKKTLDSDDHRKIVSDYLKNLPDNLQKH